MAACSDLYGERELDVEERLQGHYPSDWKIYSYRYISTTMAAAKEFGAEGCPTAVFAKEQRLGRGRLERKWESPKEGMMVTFSFPIRPAGVSADVRRQLASFSLVCGVTLRDVLVEYGVGKLGLKWPNDVYFGQEKLAGVLLEFVSGESERLLVGTGVNLQGAPQGAASLYDSAGIEVDPELLGKQYGLQLYENFALFQEHGFSHFRERWHDAALFLGDEIRFQVDKKDERRGLFAGVSNDGEVQIETGDRQESFSSGDLIIDWSKEG